MAYDAIVARKTFEERFEGCYSLYDSTNRSRINLQKTRSWCKGYSNGLLYAGVINLGQSDTLDAYVDYLYEKNMKKVRGGLKMSLVKVD